MKFRNSKKIWIIFGTFFVAVLSGAVICYTKSDKVERAFQKQSFEQVQLTITHTVTDIQALYGEEATDEIEENQATYTEQLSNIRKNGTTIYERNEFAEEYQYMRNGEELLLYAYNDPYGVEPCKWIEVSIDERNPFSLFDFEVFNDYSAKDFRKVDDYYVPKGDVPTALCHFLQVNSAEGYYDCEMRFYIEEGRLTKVVATYIYKNQLDIERIYEFTYKNEEIKIPDASSI